MGSVTEPVVTRELLASIELPAGCQQLRRELFRVLVPGGSELESAGVAIFHTWQTELRALIAGRVDITGVTGAGRRSLLEMAPSHDMLYRLLTPALEDMARLGLSEGLCQLHDEMWSLDTSRLPIAVCGSVCVLSVWAQLRLGSVAP